MISFVLTKCIIIALIGILIAYVIYAVKKVNKPSKPKNIFNPEKDYDPRSSNLPPIQVIREKAINEFKLEEERSKQIGKYLKQFTKGERVYNTVKGRIECIVNIQYPNSPGIETDYNFYGYDTCLEVLDKLTPEEKQKLGYE